MLACGGGDVLLDALCLSAMEALLEAVHAERRLWYSAALWWGLPCGVVHVPFLP